MKNEQYRVFCDEILKWSKAHNITNYKTQEKIYENIEDSVYPLEFIHDFENALDVGSGGGFPAILLAIAKENAHFTLLEPNAKKAAFLRTIASKLALKNVRIERARIQDFKCESNFDLITSRALFSVNKLIEFSARFLRGEGHFLFYKGINCDEKIDTKNCIIRKQRLYFYKSKKEVQEWLNS